MHNDPAQKAALLAFMHTQPMATIATIDTPNHRPESALIAFAELPTLEIIFETFYDTRKYENLQRNPAVAIVIGWDPVHHITVQYEGLAAEVQPDEVAMYRELFLRKDTPCTEEFLCHPKVRIFKVQPTWIAYADYTGDTPQVHEFSF